MDDRAELRRLTPPEEYAAAQELHKEKAARFLNEEGQALLYTVGRLERRAVSLGLGEELSGSCGCGWTDGLCRHIAASFLEAIESGRLEPARWRTAQENAQRLRGAMGKALPDVTPLSLEVTLHLPEKDGPLRVSLRTGQERLYVVSSIAQFFTAMEQEKPIAQGKRGSLQPSWQSYGPEDRRLLLLLNDAADALRLSGCLPRTGMQARFLSVPERFVPRLLELLEDHPFRLTAGEKEYQLPGIHEGRIDLLFAMTTHGREIEIRAEAPEGIRRIDRHASCVFCAGEALRLPKEQQAVLETMTERHMLFCFKPEEKIYAVSELLPWLRRAGYVTVEGRLKDKLENRPLHTDIRLDREMGDVLCSVTFRYGETAIDPFRKVEEKNASDDLIMVRDSKEEHRVIGILAKYGFRMKGERVALHGSDRIWLFLTEGVQQLEKYADVWYSEAFRLMRPHKPSLNARVRIYGSSLRFEVLLNGEPVEDAEEIMRALAARKSWFRLRSGEFLDLSDLDDWEDYAEAVLEPENQTDVHGIIEIKSYRAAYLMSLLEEKNPGIEVDEETKRRYTHPQETEPCPEPLRAQLRPYQERGFSWLQTLYRLRMGGVLADDMGLGKTVQVIALIFWAVQKEKEKKPSVIVAPTSLVYNWASEIGRFAPDMKVLIAEGSQQAREEQIRSLTEEGAADIYLTSYPLIRRDISLVKEISFRFAVLDEAQYIKNAASVGAGAVRRLEADARFAITGTPMENHPGELWSIFDFALPGYLGTFSSFMQRYGEGKEADHLSRRIRPFLLRRLKNDVLTELPEKTENTITVEMTPDQSRIYWAALQRLKPNAYDLGGSGRFRVLAALTELREICGHPSLVLPEYAGSSGKMELLMDLLAGGLESGHRALIFSQFTRMLRIIERRLTVSGVECFYLDGETPARERVARVNRFNEGEGQVFLISLKAGGSGLNLTGADWVVHYDPWWNPAAEDQATDRAHRIGQKRPVTVTRLVTRNTIEEQVVKMGQRKRELFDRMIEAGESLPTQLTDEEIRSLFDI